MPLDPFSLISGGGLNVLSAGIGLFTGLSQKHKAKRLLKGLTYPTEGMPDELLQNQQMARIRANTGMPTAQYGQAQQNIARQQNKALSGLQDRRAGLLGVSAANTAANDANLNLDVQNANTRMANERQLMNVNSQVANVRRDLFDKNVRSKYNRDYNYAMQLLGTGNQNFTNGLDKLGAGLGYGAAAMLGGGNGYYGGDITTGSSGAGGYVPGQYLNSMVSPDKLTRNSGSLTLG